MPGIVQSIHAVTEMKICNLRYICNCGWDGNTHRMPSSGMLRHVALERTDVSEERIASIIRVTRIGKLGITLAVASHVVPSASILVTLMMVTIHSSETSVLQEPYGATSQKTAFFIVTAVRTSSLTQ
jgi:hypothetical protein